MTTFRDGHRLYMSQSNIEEGKELAQDWSPERTIQTKTPPGHRRMLIDRAQGIGRLKGRFRLALIRILESFSAIVPGIGKGRIEDQLLSPSFHRGTLHRDQEMISMCEGA